MDDVKNENIEASKNNYDKMPEYIKSVFAVFKMVHSKASKNNDKKFMMIAIMIYNYVRGVVKDSGINLKDISAEPFDETINLIPIFEYITYNSVELYDFSSIKMEDVDINKKSDLERFALTHIYYITQPKN
jgi:hypothetical protein